MRIIILMSATLSLLLPVGLTLLLFGTETVLDIVQLVPNLSEEPDWAWVEEPVLYRPDDLFEYVNGAAPQYLAYGFSGLVHSRCAYKGEDLNSVTLDIFDMGSVLGAYGIYSSGRPREIRRRIWGTEGYRSGTVTAAWKGRIYLHGSADEDTPELISRLETFMEQVITAVPGDSKWPPERSMLPLQDLIAGSDRYIGKDLLGHSFLPGGFLANYEVEGGEGLLFVSDLGDPERAGKAFGLFYSFEHSQGTILRKGKIGAESFWAQDPGLGIGAVFWRRSYVAGLWGVRAAGSGEGILAECDSNLTSGTSKE